MTMIYDVVTLLVSYLVCYFNIFFLLGKSKRLFGLFGALFFLLSLIIPMPFRLLYQQFVFVFLFYFASRDFRKTIVAVLFNYFILLTMDTIVSLLFLIGHIDYSVNTIARFVATFSISFLSYIFIRRKLIIELWEVLQKRKRECFYVLILVFGALLYINVGYRYHVESIIIMSFLLLIFMYVFIRQFVQSYHMKLESEMMMSYIEECEKHLDELQIQQHEYKNILACIKGMVPNNKRVGNFIDNLLLEETHYIDYDVMQDVEKVAVSPIKGLLYYKMFHCKQNGVYVVLNVSSDIYVKRLNKIEMSTLTDVTKILGILIDNAFDACIETEQRSLSIYLYEENRQIIFQVSNTFAGTLNMGFLYKTGYSTKGKGHGYGLSYAKKIVRANRKLSLSTEVRDDVFIQYLKIDLQNKKS